VVAISRSARRVIAFARMMARRSPPFASRQQSVQRRPRAQDNGEIGRKTRESGEGGLRSAYSRTKRFVGCGVAEYQCGAAVVVGAIAVSGLPQTEDIRLATWAAGLIEGP